MTKWTCAHGLGLSEQCRECELDDAREIVARWGERVDEARRALARETIRRVKEMNWEVKP